MNGLRTICPGEHKPHLFREGGRWRWWWRGLYGIARIDSPIAAYAHWYSDVGFRAP
jgi:hypothetical protein